MRKRVSEGWHEKASFDKGVTINVDDYIKLKIMKKFKCLEKYNYF